MAFARQVTRVATARAGHPRLPITDPVVQTTLLELVRTLGEITDDETEIVATVIHMLRTGSIRLTGSLRDLPADRFLD